jgi:uncharacterized protein with FMN-binding domain
MKKILKVVAIVITVLVIIFAGLFLFVTRGLDAKSQPALAGVTAQGLKDGIYEGGYESGRFTNRVKVTVAGEKIGDIALAQDVLFSDAKVSAELFQRVIAAQSTQVDVVSGSTVTGKAYLKSIENALTSKEE